MSILSHATSIQSPNPNSPAQTQKKHLSMANSPNQKLQLTAVKNKYESVAGRDQRPQFKYQ